jgi:hypothetical protein
MATWIEGTLSEVGGPFIPHEDKEVIPRPIVLIGWKPIPRVTQIATFESEATDIGGKLG